MSISLRIFPSKFKFDRNSILLVKQFTIFYSFHHVCCYIGYNNKHQFYEMLFIVFMGLFKIQSWPTISGQYKSWYCFLSLWVMLQCIIAVDIVLLCNVEFLGLILISCKNMFISYPIILEFCTEHGTDTAVLCATFKTIGQLIWVLWMNALFGDFSLRCVSNKYPILHSIHLSWIKIR